MMGKRDSEIQLLRELYEEKLKIKDESIQELNSKISELKRRIEDYEKKGDYIVNAMTEAEQNAGRKIKEAEQSAFMLKGEAESIKKAAEEYAKESYEAARKKAADVIAQADEDAKIRMKEIAAAAGVYKKTLENIKKLILDVSEDVQVKLQSFSGELENLAYELTQKDDTEVLLSGLTNAENITEDPEFPENYENASQVLQSIYRLREVSKEEAEQECEGKVWTVDEVIGDDNASDEQILGDIDSMIDRMLSSDAEE